MQVDVTPSKVLAVLTIMSMLIGGGWSTFVVVEKVYANERGVEDNRDAGKKRDETLRRVTDLLEEQRKQNEEQRKRNEQQRQIRSLCKSGRISDPEICAREELERR